MKIWDYKVCPSLAQLKDQLNAVEEEGGKILNVVSGWNGMVIVYSKESDKMPICQCGCGQPVAKPSNMFIHGHHLKTAQGG